MSIENLRRDWKVVFHRPKGDAVSTCEIVVLSEAFNVKQGEAHNHLLGSRLIAEVLMVEKMPKDKALELVNRANDYLKLHEAHNAQLVGRRFAARQMDTIH